MSEKEKYPCVFGYGECPIRRLLVEEQRQTRMLLASMPVELPASKEMPEQVRKEMNVFLQAMMAPMLSMTQAVGVIRDLGPFCAACPKVACMKMIVDLMKLEKEVPAISPEGVRAPNIPHIDIADLNDCPWQTFKKEPARPGQAAWIRNPVRFTSWKDPPAVLLEVVKALKRAKDGKLLLGDMTYSFSGDEDRFINRKPAKEVGAR